LVTSAGKALDAIRSERFNLILMDIKMPGRDGLSLMREVKEKWPDIPVIVMSGYATTETMNQVSETEASCFIEKPFTPDELLDPIRKVLEKEANLEYEEDSGYR
jgi:DNA-binding NtrC family response regulator